MLEKHKHYHQAWFLEALPEQWKESLNQQEQQARQIEAKPVTSNPGEHIDVNQFKNPDGTVNVELFLKSAPILYVRHADNSHAVRCHFCPFQIPLNKNATFGLYERQIRKHEICHVTVGGSRKKSCPYCSFRTRSFDSFKAHCKVHSPENERKMAAGVLILTRPDRQDIAEGVMARVAADTTVAYPQMLEQMTEDSPELEMREIELTKACSNEDAATEEEKKITCAHCPFYVTQSPDESELLKSHEARHASTEGKYKCPKCKYCVNTHKLFLAHIALHPQLQIVESGDFANSRKSSSSHQLPVHQCHICNFTSSNGSIIFSHVKRHSLFQQKYSTSAMGISGASLHYCGQCAFVTSVRHEMKTHLDTCTGKVKMFYDALHQSDQISPEESVEGELFDDPGVQHTQPCLEVGTTPEVIASPVKEQAVVPQYTQGHPAHQLRPPRVIGYGGTSYDCEICEYTSTSEFHFMKHMLGHTDKGPNRRYKCSICGYGALKTIRLQQHMQLHHKSTGTVLSTAIRTQRVDDSKSHFLDLRAESAGSKRGYTVEGATLQKETHSSFVKVSNTNQHVLVVGNCTRYRCSKCDFVTDKKRVFKTHWYGHTCSKAARPEECPTCGYRSDTKYRLEFHMKKHHKVPGKARDESSQLAELQALVPSPRGPRSGRVSPRSPRPGSPYRARPRPVNLPYPAWRRETTYYCDMCPFYDTSRETYVQHQQCHQRVQNFRCLYCTFSTDSKDSLRQHIKSHFTVAHQEAALAHLEKELEAKQPNGEALHENAVNGETEEKEEFVAPADEELKDGQDKICPYCDVGIKIDVFSHHVMRHTQGAMYLTVTVN